MALMYYLIYKTTNNITGKFYIGTHKTNNKNDSYMGSGKYLNYAIMKYGIENFTKEILFEYDNPEEMFIKEAEIVDEDFLASENTYNLKKGGHGGFDYINSSGKRFIHTPTVEMNKLAVSRLKNICSDKNSEEYKNFCKTRNTIPSYGFKGKSHTEDTKEKLSLSLKGKLIGNLNSQYGTMWITNGVVNKKIQKDSIIPLGWNKGRKLK